MCIRRRPGGTEFLNSFVNRCQVDIPARLSFGKMDGRLLLSSTSLSSGSTLLLGMWILTTEPGSSSFVEIVVVVCAQFILPEQILGWSSSSKMFCAEHISTTFFSVHPHTTVNHRHN